MHQLRGTMEKLLRELEDDIVITNSSDARRAFLNKTAYRYAIWTERLRTVVRRLGRFRRKPRR